MNKYLVTLKPLSPFFFGGENTLGDGKINYFAQSNYLPQQTTILGMLRHQLLIQNNLIGTDPIAANWKDLIGAQSFQRINDEFVNEFGAIQNISPIFLTNGKDHFTTQSLDWALYEFETASEKSGQKINNKGIAPIVLNFESSAGDFIDYGGNSAKVPSLKVANKHYDPKFGLISLWIDSTGSKIRPWDYIPSIKLHSDLVLDNGLFKSHEQIGIHRILSRRRSDKGDFYKQVSFNLRDDFAFAFFLELELPVNAHFSSTTLIMGGEKSVFKMEVTDPKEMTFENIFNALTFTKNNPKNHEVIILLSDCYCDDNILNHCSFSINDVVNFKNIITSQKDKVNYAAFVKGGLSKSAENLKLFKRGSVLYPKEGETQEVEAAIKNRAFGKIGYNKYLVINPKNLK